MGEPSIDHRSTAIAGEAVATRRNAVRGSADGGPARERNMQPARSCLILISSILVLAGGAAGQAAEPIPPPSRACAEDASEPPTISRRFDLQPGDGAVSFHDAR